MHLQHIVCIHILGVTLDSWRVGSVLSCRLRTYIKLQGTFLLFQQHLFPTLAPFNKKRRILIKRLHCIVVRFDNAQGFGLNQNPGCKHVNDE